MSSSITKGKSALLEFTAPREVFHIDVDALRAMIPMDIVVKRVLVDIALTQLPGPRSPAQALSDVGVDYADLGPYQEVSWHDYFRVMVFLAETIRGREHLSVGLREIGRNFYRGVHATTLGEMLLGRRLGDAIRNMADTWAEFNTLGRVWSDFTGERSFDYHFESFPRVLAESVGVGVFEGTFGYHFMTPTILIASDAPDNAILRISW